MLHIPFYDPKKSYEQNYEEGPFGEFSNDKIYEQKGKPKNDFYGNKIYTPFGIPAGPIVNSRFAKSAFEKGFDLVVYKTVRSSSFPCHPYPNVIPIENIGNLTLEKLENPLTSKDNYEEPLSITNSFGVPSKTPDFWQEDVKKSISYAGKGQLLILSFMGTVRENQTQQEFIDDYALSAKLSLETNAKVLETNLSCPNIGNEGLVCYNIEVTERVCDAIRNVIGNTPLIIKIGYFKDQQMLKEIAKIANKYADGISAINTLQAEIRNEKGEQALPGENRLRSGVCGSGIKWAGLEMVKRLDDIRNDNNYKFKIEGVGGVMNVEDYSDYINAGADSVMSATGAMWNPLLAQEIKSKI